MFGIVTLKNDQFNLGVSTEECKSLSLLQSRLFGTIDNNVINRDH